MEHKDSGDSHHRKRTSDSAFYIKTKVSGFWGHNISRSSKDIREKTLHCLKTITHPKVTYVPSALSSDYTPSRMTAQA
ncbi:hypothetical protein AYI68_g4729 [Smittium mucronatum]|uniref:Uncharacterized protein n=1 Tax=Smittium mucronatum TaxID=133383 RepID=A0A1R0GWE3_9FUNG|nr:hypothetical protein AYI68_g4729 [Smittium mucronatum]